MNQVLCFPSMFSVLSNFFYFVFLFFINNHWQGAGFSCYSLNLSSTHCVSRSSLKILWIAHPSGSSSWNSPEPMFFEILKGPYLLLFNFFESQFKWIFLFSSHTLSLTFSPWRFHLLLLNYFFIFSCASFIAFVVCFQLFCIPIRNSSTCGISVWTTRLPFYQYLPKFSSNSVLLVVVCFLLLYWNSTIASQSVQLSCW